MHAIVKYVATDGTEWGTAQLAATRDELDARVRAIEARLGPAVERGRRRIDQTAAADAKVDVVRICRELYPDEEVFRLPAHEIHPFSYAGRFLSDAGGPLNRIWWRFSCMDGEWEYEQPFCALNPDKFDAAAMPTEEAAAR